MSQNAHTQFPVPQIRSSPAFRAPGPRFLVPLPSSDPAGPSDSPSPVPDAQDDKENAGPTSPLGDTPNASSQPAPTSDATSTTVTGLTQPPIAPGSLPGPIAALLDEITSYIMKNFSDYPPHTIQRLAELVLHPKRHYRSLTGYLHALDRVVHVTSGSNIYPLPPAISDMGQMSNGVGGSTTIAPNSFGTDEALGGALLTPIPWLSNRSNGADSEDGFNSEDGSLDSPVSTRSEPVLHASPERQQQHASPQSSAHPSSLQHTNPQIRTDNTETIEGPNGMGTIETVSISVVNGVPSMTSSNTVLTSRGVSQGELLRQEQRAGVVPLNQLVRQQQQQQQARIQSNGNGKDADDDEAAPGSSPADEQDPEIPHAQGPEEINDADIGPQRAGTSQSATYTIGTTTDGTSIQLQGIDIEAAVGRHVDGTPLEEPRKSSPDHEMETSVPQSPKREAEEDLDELASKKQKTDIKEEDDKEGEDTVMVPLDVPSATNGEVEKKEDVDEKDAEGDVVIRDPDLTEASIQKQEEEPEKKEDASS